MDFDDIFENEHKHHGHHRTKANHDEDRSPHESYHSEYKKNDNFEWSKTLEKINSNKGLKQLVRVAFIFFLLLAIALIIVLIPYIIKLINYIGQNGLQGLWEVITSFIGKLWNGSAK